MPYKKKLIEVALPLEAINAESAREKSIRHGHPSTLHLWWARRPLAAARAVIFSSLVDDPSAHPEQFPTEEEQSVERRRLFDLMEQLVKWENSNNEEILNRAKAEILKSTDGKPPALLDPFAGGGSIPLEAQRLGLEAHASDLNPVAVMINKAMIEIPPKFAGQPPVNPESRRSINDGWAGARGLAEDVRYYGEWMKKKAFERIGHMYPTVRDEHGREQTVIAWIWARTVKCPNPACGCEMPLAKSFELSRKGEGAYIQPYYQGTTVRFSVLKGKDAPNGTIISRRGAKCMNCGSTAEFAYIREQGLRNGIVNKLMAVVAEQANSRIFLTPDSEQLNAASVAPPEDAPESELPEKALGINIKAYGFNSHTELFTNRQLNAVTTFSDLVSEAQKQAITDGGSDEYANALGVYLAFGVSRMSDINNAFCRWEVTKTQVRNLFTRQAIPIIWDFAENNVFGTAAGGYLVSLSSIARVLDKMLVAPTSGHAAQHDAQTDNGLRNVMISTDPPYYDNIGYADLSDFFYVWLRQSLRTIYPDLFQTLLVPKVEELVANPFRFGGSSNTARQFFESGMLVTFKQIFSYATQDVPVTVYYAFKQTDEDENKNTSSAGWETMLSAMIEAGFTITGTWPIRTEEANRMRGLNSNALASSIVLVCRKRPADAPICTGRDFINTLKRELKPALAKLQASNIAPVDLAQSAIGPGIGVYSRFSKVLEADGTPMSVRSALQIINQELDLYFTEQDGELDRDSRFCVDLFSQNAFNDMKFGEADVLARAKNTSVEKLADHGVLHAQKGVVRLLTREEIPEKVDSTEPMIWLLTQQLTRAMETGGVVATAQIVADMYGSNVEQAKALAYRLFTIAERKGWAGEAYAYNSLVIAWPDVQSRAADLQSQRSGGQQMTLFDETNS